MEIPVANSGASRSAGTCRLGACRSTPPREFSRQAKSDELGKPVHRLRESSQGIASFVVHTVRPRGDGQRRNEKPRGRLGKRPVARRPKLEDREPFDRRVVRAALGWELLHASVFDAGLLAEEVDFLAEPIVFFLEADAGAGAVGGDAAGVGQGDLCERDGVHDGGSDAPGPALRKRKFVVVHGSSHRLLREAQRTFRVPRLGGERKRTVWNSVAEDLSQALAEGGEVWILESTETSQYERLLDRSDKRLQDGRLEKTGFSPVLKSDFAHAGRRSLLTGDRHQDHVGSILLVGSRTDDDCWSFLGGTMVREWKKRPGPSRRSYRRL